MRRFFVYALIACAVLASTLTLPSAGPALALETTLTSDDKAAIFARCKRAGGSGKACCAAADGAWKPDSQGGGTCTLGKSSVFGGVRSPIAPDSVLVSP